MILNSAIYEKAVYLFDDPSILELYNTNTIQFQKTLYPFLTNGVPTITEPPIITSLLSECEAPQGVTETLDGTGENSYKLDSYPPESSIFIFWNNGIVDDGATFDRETNTVTFSSEVEVDTEAVVEWYYAGAFIGDFSLKRGNFPLAALLGRITDLLSRALVLEWAKKQTNTLVDGIVNLLTDTDFKVHSPSNALKAKGEWVKRLQWDFYNLQTKLGNDLVNYNLGGFGYWT